MAKKKDFAKATPWLSAIGLFVLWELIVRIFNIPVYVLPTPSESIMVGWEFRAAIWMHALQTLYTTLAGFAIAVVFGVILGALVGRARRFTTRPIRFWSGLTRSRRSPWSRSL